ncbi:MAG: di-trans,poly-cis-decaprenylcistransferase [Clostridia bacterium]|nr:di-trans,poly-cis-decaprenylcistransferase [Clostridia bacterium]
MDTEGKIPSSVAIIMDGNGRWAKKRLLPRSAGHAAGMTALRKIAIHAATVGIKYLTVYALSTENMSRPKAEVDFLIDLLRRYFSDYIPEIKEYGARIRVIGDVSVFPDDIRELMEKAERDTATQNKLVFTIAVNYGGRDEIVRAVNRAVEDGEKVDEKSFSSLLDTEGLPDPDLVIRTGGEVRVSNFLLWQGAYSEYYFTDVYFPDFDEKEFDRAIEAYGRRDRRYGRLKKGDK